MGPERVAGCETLTTSLDRGEAAAILEPYFEAAREFFMEAGLERCRETRFAVSPTVHDGRHFAGCRDDGRLVLVAPELVEIPDAFVVGILAHEFGHATDFLYPGEFVLRGDHVARRSRADAGEKQWARWLLAWQATHSSRAPEDADSVERTADAIARSVYGKPIGYAGPCQLQTFRRGESPRPPGLR